MTGEEVRKLDTTDLATELNKLRRKVYDLRTQAATEKIEDPSQFKKVRRDIARLLTERRARATRSSAK